MYKHLPEVLPLDIKELADGQGHVEGQLHHVVVPDPSSYPVIWIANPAVAHIPEPWLVPQAAEPIQKNSSVEKPPRMYS